MYTYNINVHIELSTVEPLVMNRVRWTFFFHALWEVIRYGRPLTEHIAGLVPAEAIRYERLCDMGDIHYERLYCSIEVQAHARDFFAGRPRRSVL